MSCELIKVRPSALWTPSGQWFDPLETQVPLNLDAFNVTSTDTPDTVDRADVSLGGSVSARRVVSSGAAIDRTAYIWIRFAEPWPARGLYLVADVAALHADLLPEAPLDAFDVTVRVRIVTTDWDPSTLTWHTQPAVDGDPSVKRVLSLPASDSVLSSYLGRTTLHVPMAAGGTWPEASQAYGVRLEVATSEDARSVEAEMDFAAAPVPVSPLRFFFAL